MTAHRFVRVLRRNAMLILGLIIVLGVTFAAVFAPLIAPFDPNELHLDAILKAPCAEFPLGTDRLGRDVLSRLLYGGRVSLWVGFVAVGISISIGALLGLFFRRNTLCITRENGAQQAEKTRCLGVLTVFR